MSVAEYVALASAVAGVITAVTALVKALRHANDPQAHNGQAHNGLQSLRLRHGGMS